MELRSSVPDYSKFSAEALAEERVQLELDLANISAQINYAQVEVYKNGKPSDPEWFASAQSAKRYKGFQHQQIIREIAVRERAQKKARQETIDRAFVNAAKSVLDADKFYEILAKAQTAIL